MPKHASQTSEPLPIANRPVGATLRRALGVTRLRASGVVCVAGLAAWCVLYAAPLSADALLYAPSGLAYILRAIFLTIVALLWTISPAIGPRYGAKVVLTPLAALAASLALPLRESIFPALIIGLLMVLIEEEPSRRAALLGRALTILAAQLVVAAGLIGFWCVIAALAGQSVPSPILPWRAVLTASALFGAAYLAAFRLLLNQRARLQSEANGGAPVDTGVAWHNELAMLGVGMPLVVSLSLMFPRLESLITSILLWLSISFTTQVTHALIEGDMLRRQLRAMDRLTQQAAIGKSPTPDRLLTDYFDQCAKLILYDRASIWQYNDQDMVLQKTLEYCGGSVPFSPMMRRFGEELVGRVAERAKPMLADDVRSDPRHAYCALPADAKAAMGPVSVMIIPLLASGELVGVAEFERRSIESYRRTDRERVQSLCSLVAMSMANNRLHQDVMQQAVTDGLTGLYNKRQILKTLADEGARAQRYGKSLSVMMLDLDGFKKFNDTFGHMQGDVLLQGLSNLIRQSIRAADIAGRYGGEEFIVVMPETGREAAWVSAERIRARVEAEEFKATVNYEAAIGLEEPTEDRMPRTITVHRTISIGVATFPADALSADALLERADEALYAAKNDGRNRVCLASYPEESLPRTVREAGQS